MSVALRSDPMLAGAIAEKMGEGMSFGEAARAVREEFAPVASPLEAAPDSEAFLCRWACAALRAQLKRPLVGLEKLSTQAVLDWVTQYIPASEFVSRTEAMFKQE